MNDPQWVGTGPTPPDPVVILDDPHQGDRRRHDEDDRRDGGDDVVSLGQSMVAEALVAANPGRFMYVPGIGWHHYNGTHWDTADNLAEKLVEQAVVDTARTMIGTAATMRGKDARNQVLQAAGRALSTDAHLRGVVAFASRHPDVLVGMRQLNAGPFLLNCGNGTLELLTGDLRPHNPKDRLTKVTAANYDPQARGPRWQDFLLEALGDEELVTAVRQLMGGPGLMGHVREHVLPVIYGRGGSGKGTFINAIADVLGGYAIAAEPDLVMRRAGAHPTGEMDLHGVRLAFVSESDEGRQLAASTMKRLTGGDKIRARKMRQDFVEFDATHLLVLVTNHLPVMPAGDDPAIWRRVRVIPFDTVPTKIDRRLPDRLAAESDAILTWLVDGFTDYWNRQDITWPESVLDATAAYRSGSDLLGAFLDDVTIANSVTTTRMGEVYRRWRSWLAGNAPDGKPGRVQDLVRGLRERGEDVRQGDSRNKGTVLGGRLFVEEDPE